MSSYSNIQKNSNAVFPRLFKERFKSLISPPFSVASFHSPHQERKRNQYWFENVREDAFLDPKALSPARIYRTARKEKTRIEWRGNTWNILEPICLDQGKWYTMFLATKSSLEGDYRNHVDENLLPHETMSGDLSDQEWMDASGKYLLQRIPVLDSKTALIFRNFVLALIADLMTWIKGTQMSIDEGRQSPRVGMEARGIENLVWYEDAWLLPTKPSGFEVWIVSKFDGHVNFAAEAKNVCTETLLKYIAREILNGIGFLHKNGYQHGALEAYNVRIMPSGRIKLANWMVSSIFESHVRKLMSFTVIPDSLDVNTSPNTNIPTETKSRLSRVMSSVQKNSVSITEARSRACDDSATLSRSGQIQSQRLSKNLGTSNFLRPMAKSSESSFLDFSHVLGQAPPWTRDRMDQSLNFRNLTKPETGRTAHHRYSKSVQDRMNEGFSSASASMAVSKEKIHHQYSKSARDYNWTHFKEMEKEFLSPKSKAVAMLESESTFYSAPITDSETEDVKLRKQHDSTGTSIPVHSKDIYDLGLTLIHLANYCADDSTDVKNSTKLKKAAPSNGKHTLLSPERWSIKFSSFLVLCMEERAELRPTSQFLLQHDFITQLSEEEEVHAETILANVWKNHISKASRFSNQQMSVKGSNELRRQNLRRDDSRNDRVDIDERLLAMWSRLTTVSLGSIPWHTIPPEAFFPKSMLEHLEQTTSPKNLECDGDGEKKEDMFGGKSSNMGEKYHDNLQNLKKFFRTMGENPNESVDMDITYENQIFSKFVSPAAEEYRSFMVKKLELLSNVKLKPQQN